MWKGVPNNGTINLSQKNIILKNFYLKRTVPSPQENLDKIRNSICNIFPHKYGTWVSKWTS